MTGPQDILETLKDEPRDLFSRAVALCAVITTLVAAAVAFLHASASREGDRAAAAAQRAAIEAAHTAVKRRQIAQVELRRLQLGREYHARELNVLQRRLLGFEGDRALRIDAAHWHGLAVQADRQLRRSARRQETPDISRGAPASPQRDPFFPSRMLAQTERRGIELAALRDARNELSSEWGKRGAVFIAILTLLAVALYLFGFSLTPQGRHMRGVFAAFGAVFLVIGVIFGPMQALFPPTAPPDEAAARYADGTLALKTATAPRDYAAAVEAFDEAIRLRPGFARAYVDRAAARIAAASPQDTSFLSLAPTGVREAAIRDLEKARELGLDTPSVIGGLGFELLALGLETGSNDDIDESVGLTKDAIQADPHEPVFLFNLGAALLAAGRLREARDAYRAAIGEVVRQGKGRSRVRARADALGSAWVSGALTDLEMVARHRGIELADDVRAVKELIVGSHDSGRMVKPRSPGFLSDVDLAAGPGWLQLNLRAGKRLRLKDAWLATHWYQREPGFGWSHLEHVSGPCVHRALYVPCELVADDGGEYFGFVTYPDNTFPPRCLTPGDYRVELYDKGRLVGEARTRSTQRAFVAFEDKDTGVVGCRPRGWADAALDDAGLIRGYASDDRRSGLYVVRLNNLVAADAAADRASGVAIDRLLERLRPVFRSELRLVGEPDFNFMELEPGTQVLRHYRYGRRHLLVGAGRDADRSIVTGLAFGSAEAYRRHRLREMLAALALRYQNPSVSDPPAAPDRAVLASQEVQ